MPGHTGRRRRLASQDFEVTANLPDTLPVTEAELRLLEAHVLDILADLMDHESH